MQLEFPNRKIYSDEWRDPKKSWHLNGYIVVIPLGLGWHKKSPPYPDPGALLITLPDPGVKCWELLSAKH